MDTINNINLSTKNIYFGKPVNVNNNIFKIKVYSFDQNKQITALLKPTIITHTIEQSIDWNNLKFKSLKICLDPLIGPNLDLYNIIEHFESISYKHLKKLFNHNKKNNFIFKNSIYSINQSNDLFIDETENFNITYINFKIIKDVIHYNNNNDIINPEHSYLHKYIIEFNELWYDVDKKTGGCNFNIIQIKHIDVYFKRNLFDNNISIERSLERPIERSIERSIERPINNKPNETTNQDKILFKPLLLNSDMLLSQMAKLKKTY